ncbi:MAG: L-threonylcarbamoyladenylate synthase [Pseudomonadota bacterium]|jgi:L-threonylcarbamoyladenylate synthase|nr:threonylcarbamoyl-AMP synthase [Alphaproteobacteria bacterium]
MPIITSEAAIKYLCEGEIVAIPTETVYGLAANATDDKAIAKVYSLKNRPQFNPLIMHVDSIEMVEKWAVISKFTKTLMKEFWYGRETSISFVLELKKNHPLSLLALAGLDTVAVRRPNHPITLNILSQISFPLAAPSANRSNSLSATTVAHVLDGLGESIQVIDGGACSVGLESTILDVTQDKMKILRLGAVTKEDLEPFGEVDHGKYGEAIKAPGMMSRHYAPQRLLKMNVLKKEEGMALLGFGVCERVDLNLSMSSDLNEAAANLFRYLHELDREPFVSIGVTPIPDVGIGMAINDRLRRACSEE